MFSTCSKSIQVILQNSVNICAMWCFSTIRAVVKLSLTSFQSTPANPKQQLLQTGNSEQMLYVWPQFAVSCFTEDFWFSFCLFVCFFFLNWERDYLYMLLGDWLVVVIQHWWFKVIMTRTTTLLTMAMIVFGCKVSADTHRRAPAAGGGLWEMF